MHNHVSAIPSLSPYKIIVSFRIPRRRYPVVGDKKEDQNKYLSGHCLSDSILRYLLRLADHVLPTYYLGDSVLTLLVYPPGNVSNVT